MLSESASAYMEGPSRMEKLMGKRKNRGNKGNHLQATAFKFIRLGALVMPAAVEFLYGADTPQGKMFHTIRRYTGYDFYNRRFDFGSLAEGWGPYLGAVLTTYGIPKISKIIRSI